MFERYLSDWKLLLAFVSRPCKSPYLILLLPWKLLSQLEPRSQAPAAAPPLRGQLYPLPLRSASLHKGQFKMSVASLRKFKIFQVDFSKTFPSHSSTSTPCSHCDFRPPSPLIWQLLRDSKTPKSKHLRLKTLI